MNKKGNLSLFFVFIILASVLLFIGVFVAPMGSQLSTEMYIAGESIINSSANRVDMIENEEVKAGLNDLFDSAQGATNSNISITTNMFKYSAFILVLIVLIVLFLYSRRLVEYGGMV